MAKTPAPPVPNYLPALLNLVAGGRPGEVRDVFVLHDDDCRQLAGVGPCACSPVVTLGFGLWHRKARRRAWKLVAMAATPHRAWDAIKASGRKNGDWCVLPAGRRP